MHVRHVVDRTQCTVVAREHRQKHGGRWLGTMVKCQTVADSKGGGEGGRPPIGLNNFFHQPTFLIQCTRTLVCRTELLSRVTIHALSATRLTADSITIALVNGRDTISSSRRPMLLSST